MGTDHTSAKGHAARLTNLQSLAEPRKTPEKPVFELQPFEARLFAGSMMSPLGDPVDPVPSGGFSLAALTKDARHDTPAEIAADFLREMRAATESAGASADDDAQQHSSGGGGGSDDSSAAPNLTTHAPDALDALDPLEGPLNGELHLPGTDGRANETVSFGGGQQMLLGSVNGIVVPEGAAAAADNAPAAGDAAGEEVDALADPLTAEFIPLGEGARSTAGNNGAGLLQPMADEQTPVMAITSVTSSRIDLEWTDPRGTSDYWPFEVQYAIGAGAFETWSSDLYGTTAQFTSVDPSTSYRFRVAYAYEDPLVWSDEVSTTTPALTAPTSLAAPSQYATHVKLQWSHSADDEAGFKIERSPNGTTFTEIATVGANVTQYDDVNLTPDTDFWYRVRAYRRNAANTADVYSAFSNVLPASTDASPETPTNLESTLENANDVALTWTNNAPPDWYHQIEIKRTGTNPYTTSEYVEPGLDSYTLYGDWYGFTQGTYEFRIRALPDFGSEDYSDWSNTVTVVIDVPNAVDDLTATATSQSKVRLNWTDRADDEQGYVVQRRRLTAPASNWEDDQYLPADSSTYLYQNLTPQTQYEFRVYSYSGAGDSAFSNIATATTPQPRVLEVPHNVTATATSTSSITITWNPTAGEEHYELERSLNGVSWTMLDNDIEFDTQSYTDNGLTEGKSYYYRLRAYDDEGYSLYSPLATTTTLPNAPSTLAAAFAGADGIKLTWQDHSAGETGFRIERSPDGSTGWVEIGAVAANILTYTDTRITEGQTYHYRVFAYTAGGKSAASNVANTQTTLVAPANAWAARASDTAIDVYWTDLSRSEQGYQIERSTDGGNNFTALGTAPADATHFADTTVQAGVEYTYRVRATAGTNTSGWSNNARSRGAVTIITPTTDLNGAGVKKVISSDDGGDGTITIVDGKIKLVEGDSFTVALERPITIPSGPAILKVDFFDPVWDTSDTGAGDDNSIKDAFEVALLDADGNPLTGTFQIGRDAFFNITEGEDAAIGGQATRDGNSLLVNLQDLPAGAAVLVVRLVNNDEDVTSTVSVPGQPITDRYSTVTGQPTTPEGASYTVNFEAFGPGSNTIDEWVITWESGQTTTVAAGATGSASYTFKEGPGSKMISAVGSNPAGDQFPSSAPLAVTVNNVLPVLGELNDVSVPVNGTFNFSAAFTDAGVLDTHSAEIDWFGNGTFVPLTVTETSGTGTGTLTKASPAFAEGGFYTAVVRVRDDDDATWVTGTFFITVDDTFIVIDAPDFSDEGEQITVNAYADGSMPEMMNIWEIDWGDGSPAEGQGDRGVSATHTYVEGEPTEYTITVRAGHIGNGFTHEATHVITVRNVAPEFFPGGSQPIAEGGWYSALAWVQDAGIEDVLSATINWGDGSPIETFTDFTTGGGDLPMDHRYLENGTFTVTVTLTDDDDGQTVSTFQVDVANTPPSLYVAGSASTTEGSAYTLRLAAADPGTDTISSWTIDWGDSSPLQTVPGNTTSVTHIFQDGPATPRITVTATDEDGTYSGALAYDRQFSVSGPIVSTLSAHNAVAIQPDGKIVLVGAQPTGATLWEIVRYNADGTLDASFGTNGRVTTNFGSNDGTGARDVRVLSTGKILAVGTAAGNVALARYNANGTLDTTFGSGGTRVTDVGGGDTGVSLALNAAGDIFVGAQTSNSGTADWAILRYTAGGTLNSSFGNNGIVVTNLGGYDSMRGIAVTPSNGVVAVGSSANSLAVARYTSAGVLDTTFDGDGKLITNFGGSAYATDVAVLPDSKILVAGGVAGDTSYDLIVARYNTNGTLDPSFGTGGTSIVDFGGNEDPAQLALTSGGNVVVTATLSTDAGVFDIGVARITSTGALDADFGVGGKLTAQVSMWNRASAIDVDATGRIAYVGYTTDNKAIVAKLLPGNRVTVTNVNPIATISNTAPVNQNQSVTVSLTNPIDPSATDVAAGLHYTFATTVAGLATSYATAGTASSANFTYPTAGSYTVFARIYDKDGGFSQYQTTVQVNAVVVTPTISGPSTINEGAPYTLNLNVTGATPTSWTIYWGDGTVDTVPNNPPSAQHIYQDGPKAHVISATVATQYGTFAANSLLLDPTFGTNGVVTTDISTVSDFAHTVLVQPDGKMIVAGNAEDGFTIGRYNANGTIDTTFGTGGRVQAPTWNADAFALALQPDGKILAAGYREVAIWDEDLQEDVYKIHMGIVRVNANGTLDNSFGQGGETYVVIGETSGAEALAILPNGKILVTGRADNQLAVALLEANGMPDSTFGNEGGVITTFSGAPQSGGNALALLSGGKFLVGGYAGDNFALARYNADGSLDNTFDGDGRLTTEMGASDAVQSLTITGDGKIRAAGGSGNQFALAQYTSSGALDNTFDTDGRITAAFGGFVGTVITDSGGKFYAAGGGAIARYTSGGVLDTSFGKGNHTFTAGSAEGIALLSDGRLIVAGSVQDSEGYSDWMLARVGYLGVQNVAPTGLMGNTGSVYANMEVRAILYLPTDPSPVDTAAGFRYAFALSAAALPTRYVDASTDNQMEYIFPAAGTYTVYGRIFDKDDGYSDYTTDIIVDPSAPQLDDLAPITGNEGSQVSFTQSFGDIDGGTHTAMIDWGDGSPQTPGVVDDVASTVSGSHTYADNGSYTILLTVTDETELSGYASGTATIANVAPTATLSNNGPKPEASAVRVSYANPSDPSSVDTSAGFHYTFATTQAALAQNYAAAGTTTFADFTFNDNGTYTVYGRIYDKNGGFTEHTTTITVTNVAPTATLTNNGPVGINASARATFSSATDVSQPDVTAGLRYSFALTAAALASSYASASTTAFADFSFGSAGTYTIHGRVFDKDGGFTDYTTQVVVTGQPPVVVTPDISGNEGSQLAITATFTDPDGGAHTALINWGDGSEPTEGIVSEANGTVTGSHTYDDNGSYTITVTVTDGAGLWGSDTGTATIANVAPSATLSNNGPKPEGSAVRVSFASPADPSNADTSAGFHYTFATTQAALAQNYAAAGTATFADFTFNDNGTYTVYGRIYDKNGGFAQYQTSVTVTNVAPTLTLGGPNTAVEGSTYTLTLGSSDPGADTISAWDINWGDGYTTHVNTNAPNTTHIYADNGSYTISATATDEDGTHTAAPSKTITVTNAIPVLTTIATHYVKFTELPIPPVTLDLATFTDLGFSDPTTGTTETFTVEIAWGDSSTSTVVPTVTNGSRGTPTSGSIRGTHQYAQSGIYTGSITLRDDDTGQAVGNTQFTIHVEDRGVVGVPDGTVVRFDWNAKEAGNTNTLAYYRVDDVVGRIDGILPSAAGYWQKAVQRAKPIFQNRAEGAPPVNITMTNNQPGTQFLYSLLLVSNNVLYTTDGSGNPVASTGSALKKAIDNPTLRWPAEVEPDPTTSDPNDVRAKGPFPHIFFSHEEVNFDGNHHFERKVLDDGRVQFEVEDIYSDIADSDYDDMVFTMLAMTTGVTFPAYADTTKFYVVDQDVEDDATNASTTGAAVQYDEGGAMAGQYRVPTNNPLGVASELDNEFQWVIDGTTKRIYRLNASNGSIADDWIAGSIAAGATATGITTVADNEDAAQDHIWVLENNGTDRIRRYTNRAYGNQSGTISSNFANVITTAGSNPTDLVTADGTTFYVVDNDTVGANGGVDRIYVFNIGANNNAGVQQGTAWELDDRIINPSGVTLTPGPSGGNALWVLDKGTPAAGDEYVYYYDTGRMQHNTAGSGPRAATGRFKLAVLNSNPEGIADPPTMLGANGTVTWTSTDDFNGGTHVHTNTSIPNQVQLDTGITTHPVLWVPNSYEGTISLLHPTGDPANNITLGQEMGRYRTGPEGPTNSLFPSRTTVDLEGNVWVANRNQEEATVVKILHKGYIDRNNNNVMDTAVDINDDGRITNDVDINNDSVVNEADNEILPWDANRDGQPDDEKIAMVLRVGRDINADPNLPADDPARFLQGGSGTRGLAIDQNNRLWVGLHGRGLLEVYDAETGQFIKQLSGVQSYGLSIDDKGNLWTSNDVRRIDTNTMTIDPYVPNVNGYTVAVDVDGVVWAAGGSELTRYDPNAPIGERITRYTSPHGGGFRGIAIDFDRNVWAGSGDKLIKFNFQSDHKTLTTINPTVPVPLIYTTTDTPPVTYRPGGTDGLSVDKDGFVWSTGQGGSPSINNDSIAFRIHPTQNAVMDVHWVGDGSYSHTDQTGVIRARVTGRTGTWTRVADGGAAGKAWKGIDATVQTPPGTSVKFRVRAAESLAALGSAAWIDAAPGNVLDHVRGRYLEVQAILKAEAIGDGGSTTPPSPIVEDITVIAAGLPTLTILSPGNNAEFNPGTPVLVSGVGMVQHGQIVSVTCNGVPVDALDANGNFWVRVPVQAGQNQLTFVATDSFGQTVTVTHTLKGVVRAPGDFDVDSLVDVGNFRPIYHRTAFNQAQDVLFADVKIENTGEYAVNGPIVVGVRNISDPSVQVINHDGTTSAGVKFFDFTHTIDDGTLSPDEITALSESISFYNPGNVQFEYDLVLLAALNEPPRFTTAPVTNGVVAQPYRYDPDAVDPEGVLDLQWELVAGPLGGAGPADDMHINPVTGELTWTPAASGDYPVVVRVKDGRGGQTEQRFVVSVIADPGNRAPTIDSAPIVDGYFGEDYVYQPVASDPDTDDDLTWQFWQAPYPGGMTMDPETGRLTWPAQYVKGGSHIVHIAVSDGQKVDDQRFTIVIHPKRGTTAPTIISVPPTTKISTNNADWTYQPVAVDPDLPNDTLTWQIVGDPQRGTPPYMQINPTTGLISFAATPFGNQTYNLTLRVEDSYGGFHEKPLTVELVNTVATTVSGHVFDDVDQDGVRDAGENGQAGRTVYLDLNLNNKLDGGDLSAVTNSAGNYLITNVQPTDGGNYQLLIVPKSGQVPTLPAPGTDAYFFPVGNGIPVTGKDFGSYSPLAGGNRAPDIYDWPQGADAVLLAGQPFRYRIRATDADGHIISYNLVAKSGGMTHDTETGEIFWVPTPQQRGRHEIVVQADDGNGGLDNQSFFLDVVNANSTPVITSTPRTDATAGFVYQYQVRAQDAENDKLVYTIAATNNATLNGLDINGDTGLVTWDVQNVHAGAYDVTITVTDSKGATATQPYRLTVAPNPVNLPPTITNPNLGSVTRGHRYEYQVAATDPNGDALTWELISNAPNMSITQDGLITWDVPAAQATGYYDVLIKVHDGRGGRAQTNVQLHVNDNANNQPSWEGTSRWAVAGQTHRWALRYEPPHYDGPYDPDNDVLQFSLGSGAPASMSITSDGVVTYAPTVAELQGQPSRSFTVPIIVTDTFSDPVTADLYISLYAEIPTNWNNKPNITYPTPTNNPFPAAEGIKYSFKVIASDPDNELLNYDLPERPDATMTIDANGVLTWPSPTEGDHWIKIRVRDAAGAEATVRYLLRVLPLKDNTAPVITGISSTQAKANASNAFVVSVTNTDNEPLAFTATGLWTGAEPERISIDQYGVLHWLTTAADLAAGTRVIRVTVTDPDGATDSEDFTFTVANTVDNNAPTIESAGATAGAVGTMYAYDVVAEDLDDDLLTYSLDEAPYGMSIHHRYGTIRWLPTAAQVGANHVIVRVTDSKGASDLEQYVIEVNGANSPPRIRSRGPANASVNQPYSYAVIATDADRDTLTFDFTKHSGSNNYVAKPAWMTINKNTGLITGLPTSVGPFDVSITVFDGKGGSDREDYMVTVTNAPANLLPVFNFTPVTTASPDREYRSIVKASDPDGGGIDYELRGAPAGSNMNLVEQADGTALLTWTPGPEHLGHTYPITIVAIDDEEGATEFSFTIKVETNTPPTRNSNAPTTIVEGNAYVYDMKVTDADPLDVLQYSITAPGTDLTIDQQGRVRWTKAVAGSYPVTISVTDHHGLPITESFTLTVTEDSTAPTVTIEFSNNPAAANSKSDIRVVATDNAPIATRTLTIGGTTYTADADGWVREIPIGTTDELPVSASATDVNGNTGTASATLELLDPNDVTAPTADITSVGDPTADGVYIATDVIGTVRDQDGIIRYTLEYAPRGTNSYTIFKDVSYPTKTAPTAPVVDDALGVFDATLIRNGEYTIRLTAYDKGGHKTVDTHDVTVMGETKLGNFTLSEIDLQIPLSGIPLTISRSYDSLNRNFFNDFGYGWTFGMDMDVEEGAEQRETFPLDGLDEAFNDGGGISVRMAGDRDVYLTLPDGRRTKFTYDDTGEKAVFMSEPGVNATLEIKGGLNTMRWFSFNNGGGFSYWAHLPYVMGDIIGEAGLAINEAAMLAKYDFPGYVLKTPDGYQYHIDKTPRPETINNEVDDVAARIIDTNGNPYDGIYSSINKTFYNDPHLTKIVDPNGNEVDITATAITHSDGRTITFVRESADGKSGRLKYIKDSNEILLEYGYDSQGDLKTVTRLIDRAKPANGSEPAVPERRVTTTYNYTYRGTTSTHNLKSVTSPSGKTPVVNEYDEKGRLIATVDSFGNRTEFGHLADARRETVKDGRGNVTIYDYNENGDVTRFVNALGQVVSHTYEGRNISSTTIAQNSSAAFTTYYKYDEQDYEIEQSFEIDGRLVKVTRDYVDIAGQHLLAWEKDTVGNLAEFQYHPDTGKLTARTLKDHNGVVRFTQTLEYDDKGRLSAIVDAAGNRSEFDYDTFGNQIANVIRAASSDVLRKTTSTYDGHGRALTATYWKPDANQVWQPYATTTHEYDTLGRTTKVIDPENYITRLEYDADGNLFRFTDANSVITEYEYDRMGRNTKIKYAVGTTEATSESTAYDANGNRTSWTDGLSRTTNFVYDALNRLTETIFPDDTPANATDNPRERTEWGPQALPSAEIDELGRRTEFRYDVRGLKIEEIQPDATPGNLADNPRIKFKYDDAGNLIEQTDQRGNVTKYTYNVSRVVGTILPDGTPGTDTDNPTTHNDYDLNGNLIAYTNARGHTTRYVHDALGRTVETVHPDNTPATASDNPRDISVYDGVGALIKSINALGKAREWRYDRNGRVIAAEDELGNTTTSAYDGNGNLISQALGDRETTFTYDNYNRRTVTTRPDTLTQTTVYDVIGRISSTTDTADRTTSYEYDARDRMTVIRANDNTTQKRTYSPTGLVLTSTDELNKVTTFAYDERGLLLSETNPELGATSFTYDLAGNRLTLTDPEDNTTTFAYDERNRLEIETNELIKSRHYEYDAENNLVQVIDRNGRVREFVYDVRDRRIEENWISGGVTTRTINFSYDATGRLLNVQDPDSNYTYTYDDAGHLETSDTQGTPNLPRVQLTFDYDVYAERESAAATVNGVADFFDAYRYDDVGHVTRIEQSGVAGGNPVAAKRIDFGYCDCGSINQIDRYSDLGGTNLVASTHYTFDDVGNIESMRHYRGGTTIASYTWTYDDAGRTISETSSDGSSTYNYDLTNQLTGATHTTAPAESYDYDDNGNRTNDGYDTGPNNRLLTDGTYNYTYDDEGNRISRVHIASGDRTIYEWDHRNRLTRVITRNAGNAVNRDVQYTYDATDRRIGKVIDADGDGPGAAVEEWYAYDGGHIVLVFDGDGNITRRYLHGPIVDQIVADEAAATGNILWTLGDKQGTVRDIVDSAGTLLDHIRYDSFGKVLGRLNANVHLAFAYTGRELDLETGLYHYRARYYDAGVGRFISEDPMGFGAGDTNLNRYVGNNPLNETDPSGMMTLTYVEMLNVILILAILMALCAPPLPGTRAIPGVRRPPPIIIPRPRLPRLPRPSGDDPPPPNNPGPLDPWTVTVLTIMTTSVVMVAKTFFSDPKKDPAPDPKPDPKPDPAPKPDPKPRRRREDDPCFDYFMLPSEPFEGLDYWVHNVPTSTKGTKYKLKGAAFRVDPWAILDRSNGGEVTEKGRTFVRTLGKSTDDAGHGVGAEFGGGSEYDSLWEGNLFPIDPRTNQNGGYRQAEKLVEDYHYSGYTVCSHIEFIYDATSKRPDRPTAMNWMILAYHPGLDDVQQSMVPVTNP